MRDSSNKFKNEFYAEMDRIARFYPNKRAMLLPALHAAQAERSWISDETMQDVADFLGIPKTQVLEVVSFYHWFKMKPVGGGGGGGGGEIQSPVLQQYRLLAAWVRRADPPCRAEVQSEAGRDHEGWPVHDLGSGMPRLLRHGPRLPDQ